MDAGWDKVSMPHKTAAISFIKGMATGDVSNPPMYYANFMKDGSVCMMPTDIAGRRVAHMQFINGGWVCENYELA